MQFVEYHLELVVLESFILIPSAFANLLCAVKVKVTRQESSSEFEMVRQMSGGPSFCLQAASSCSGKGRSAKIDHLNANTLAWNS